MLVAANRQLYQWIRNLSEVVDFRDCISISERAENEQYDMELLLRFLGCVDILT
jgi:hypothetical protein